MKPTLILVAVMLSVNGVSFAQKKAHKVAPAAPVSAYFKKAEAGIPGIWGTIKDATGEPIADVEAMIYHVDTILASGYTDNEGHFMSNPCNPGKYQVRIVYPTSNRYLIINGVEIKKGKAMLDIKCNPPAQDSSISFAELNPKKKTEKKGMPGKK